MGCGYVQIDEPSFTGCQCDTFAHGGARRGPAESLKAAIDADNAVIAVLQNGAVFGLHISAAIAPACGTARAITTP